MFCPNGKIQLKSQDGFNWSQTPDLTLKDLVLPIETKWELVCQEVHAAPDCLEDKLQFCQVKYFIASANREITKIYQLFP